MKCVRCSEGAVDAESSLCRSHFLKYVERVFADTVKRFELFSKKDKLCVAVSGGKDSLTLLYLLKKNGYDVTALCIDEGIHDYRSHTLVDLRKFCDEHGVKLKVVSFVKEFGADLDKMIKLTGEKPCSICGTLRRYLLNKYAKRFDRLVMGHNLDDEAQAIMMNYLRYNLYVNARLGPVSGLIKDKRFVRKVKPLYLVSEKQTAAFSFLMGFVGKYVECPYTVDSFRNDVRDMLNDLEVRHKGAKRNIVEGLIDMLPRLKESYSGVQELSTCGKCGEACNGDICNACVLRGKLR